LAPKFVDEAPFNGAPKVCTSLYPTPKYQYENLVKKDHFKGNFSVKDGKTLIQICSNPAYLSNRWIKIEPVNK
jgi:hypothetical protein